MSADNRARSYSELAQSQALTADHIKIRKI